MTLKRVIATRIAAGVPPTLATSRTTQAVRELAAEKGPTLNPSYNELLLRWALEGHPSPPECEECHADLTGKNVHDTGVEWVGTCCKKKVLARRPPRERKEDFHVDG